MNFKRRIPAFIFFMLYLLTGSAAMELFKIPALISHYYGHREANKSMNLSSFLIQHYYDEDGTDKDVEEDNKLPFKSPENAGSFSFISLSPPNVQYCITDTHEGIKQLFGMYTAPFLPSQYLNTIWQPPRYGYTVT